MDTINYKEHFLNFSKNQIFLFERKSKQTDEIAEKALQNLIIPFPNFEAADFTNGFDWEIKNEKYGKSYQLYIQSLRVVNDLLIVFDKSGDLVYLNKSKEIIDSWIEYKETNPKNEMIWYDHPAANRAQLIVQFLYYAARNLDVKYDSYIKTLNDHLTVLSDDTIYNFNNHGLMMDKTLFVLGVTLDKKDVFEHGLGRATETFWYNFSSNGVHLENSPDYHSMVVGMYYDIQNFISNFGYSFSENILNYLNISKEYFNILVKPNGFLPQIGDSGNTPFSLKNKVYKNFNDFESGMNILQRSEEKPVYLSFITGYSSRVHKHFDDLSITLNYNREDIFVDAGKFNYSSSPLRRYVRSAKAHSAPIFSDVKYTRSKENRFTREVRTKGYYHFNDYSIVSGINESFEGDSSIERTVIMLNKYDLIILVDKTKSISSNEIIQNFNLDEGVVVAVEKDGTVVLKKNEVQVNIKQFVDTTPTIIDGSKEKVIGKNTIGFGKVIDTHQIQYKSQASSEENMNFLTFINMNNHLVENVSYDKNYLEFEIDNKYFYISI